MQGVVCTASEGCERQSALAFLLPLQMRREVPLDGRLHTVHAARALDRLHRVAARHVGRRAQPREVCGRLSAPKPNCGGERCGEEGSGR